MIFAAAMPFREALDSQEARAYLPTDFRSEDLAQLDPALLRRSQFSARTIDLGRLDNLASIYRDILSGRLDVATGRQRIKEYIDLHGPGGETTHDGSLTDFRSDARINLQIGTNVAMMRGLGNELQGQQPAVLDAYPARELVRVLDRKVPRDWIDRWDAARAATTMDGATSARDTGRMVALVGHPIWVALSRFGNPYAPFDYGSGMGTEDRSRREAMALGLIDLNTQIFPDQSLLRPDAGVETGAAVSDPRLRAALEAQADDDGNLLGRFDTDGIFRLIARDDDGDPIANRNPNHDRLGRFASGHTDSGGHPAGSRPRDFLGKRPAEGEDHLPDADNIARGKAAIEHLQRRKSGSVREAMFVKDLGTVEFAWGNTGDIDSKPTTHKDGGGIAHIASKHSKDLKHVPEWIVKGEKLPVHEATRRVWDGVARKHREITIYKRDINYRGNRVTLSSKSPGSARQWLVTGFKPKEE